MDRVEHVPGTGAALISFGSASLGRVSWLAGRCRICGVLVAESGIIALDSGTDCDVVVASSQMLELDARHGAGPQVHRCICTTPAASVDARRDRA